jgi:hypothetical protein
MAQSTIKKGPLQFDGKRLVLFYTSSRIPRDENSNTDKVSEMVNIDIKYKKFHQIDHILIDEEVAIKLFQEGTITSSHIYHADIKDDQVILEKVGIPTLNGLKKMKVIIMEEPDNHIATINSKGKIV